MRFFSIILLLVFLPLSNGIAQMEVSGYGGVGFRWYNRPAVRSYNNVTYYEGKVQLEADITRNVSAQWDFRGYSDNSSVEFREFSASLKYWKPLKVKIGNIRIPFGTEQMIEKEESDMVDRSYLHSKLSEKGYGGRSVAVMLSRNQKSEGTNAFPLSYYITFYKNNGLQYGTVVRIEKKFSNVEVGWSGAIQNYDGNLVTVGTSVNACYYVSGLASTIEIFLAEDPIEEKAYKEMNGTMRDVFAYGVRSHTTVFVEIDRMVLKAIEPYLEVGLWVPQSTTIQAHTLQTILGANFYMEDKVRFRINGNLLASRYPHTAEYSFYNSRVTVEFQVRL